MADDLELQQRRLRTKKTLGELQNMRGMGTELVTVIIPPENDQPIKNAVILLHGYGGDGNDISLLTLNWKRFLKNTVFLCPNGHEKCEINPTGFQWFDLSKDNEEDIPF